MQRNRPARRHGRRRPRRWRTGWSYLSALATIASAAPLLGLLGTVIGMIEIFGWRRAGRCHGRRQPGAAGAWHLHRALQHRVRPDRGIPALIFWRYFRGRVDAYLLTLELAPSSLFAHPAPAQSAAIGAMNFRPCAG